MPLHPNHDLQSDTEGLWVEGLGYIAQYHHWSDMFCSHGMIYFLRDYLLRDIETQRAAGVQLKALRSMISRLEALNSKISVYEAQ